MVTFGSTLGLTVPNFVIALWLLLVFSVGLGWLPTGGWPTRADRDWKTLIMPVITLALAPTALVARYTRSSLVEVLHAEYVRTARAKGLREHAVVAAPRAEERADPADHHPRAADPEPDHRDDLRRGDLSRARAGQVLRVEHLPARLPDDHGDHAAGRDAVELHLPAQRHPVHHRRPAHRALERERRERPSAGDAPSGAGRSANRPRCGATRAAVLAQQARASARWSSWACC